jgi:chromate transporter
MILLDLFITFFQIGLFTIGGGYAMIPLISEKVVSKGWATDAQLLDYIAVAESTPGPFSINTATFIGMNQVGVLGAVIAVLGLILPSFIIILIIAKFFMRFIEYKGVAGALRGMNPAAIGLICAAAVTIAKEALNITIALDFYKHIRYPELIIFAIVFTLTRIKKLKFNSYKIIITSALLGIIFYGIMDFL